MQPEMIIKRCHGLGNVICLLPVLDVLGRRGKRITVVTRREWLGVFSALRPEFSWTCENIPYAVDLDFLTRDLEPAQHRTDEFGELLGLTGPFATLRVEIPQEWARPYEMWRGAVVFAPEGGHPSRSWPAEKARQLRAALAEERLVLVGTGREPELAADLDLRGQLEVEQLFGILSVASAVISMDSGVLHIAAALGVPTVAVFGGIEPAYRVRADQAVVVLQAALECCPCNKHETCGERFPCIAAASPEEVAAAVALAQVASGRIIQRVGGLRHTRILAADFTTGN